MGLLSHGSRSFLMNQDYLPLALPSTDLDVLWLLTQDGGALRRFGALTDVLGGQPALGADAISRGAAVAPSRGTTSNSFKHGLSFGVINSILKAFGATGEVNLSVAGGRDVEFDYVDVTCDEVRLASLDSWLGGASLVSASGRVADLLVAERLFVVLGVLRAGGLAVKLSSDSKVEASLDVPALQQALGAGVTMKHTAERAGEIVFSGSTPLVIAAKSAQLKLEPYGFWVAEKPQTRGEVRELGGRPSYLKASELTFV